MKEVYSFGRLVLSGSLVVNDNSEVLLLYRDEHEHYETPGGRVEVRDCRNPLNLTIEDLARTAERELIEELGNGFTFKKLEHFASVTFTIPDGREAIAHKFVTRVISGQPRITEPGRFSRMEYLPIKTLGNYPISPDLKLLLPTIQKGLLKE